MSLDSPQPPLSPQPPSQDARPDGQLPEWVERMGLIARSSDSFFNFYSRLGDRPLQHHLPYHTLFLDPGETSGVALSYRPPNVKSPTFYSTQVNTSIIEWGVDQYHELIPLPSPGAWVGLESYRIYAWRTKQHTWASLLTPRLIGVAECICRQRRIPLLQQSAQQGKSFVTDDRLKEWGLYQPGAPHANDAMRHMLNAFLFTKFQKRKE